MPALPRYCTWLVLVLLGTLASRPAIAQPAAEERWQATFRILVQGRNVGTEEVSVVRVAAGLTLRSSGGIAGGGYVLRSAEIVYGAAGAPRSMKVEARLKDQVLLVATAVADGKAVSSQGGKVPRCHSAKVPQCQGATVPRCHGARAMLTSF